MRRVNEAQIGHFLSARDVTRTKTRRLVVIRRSEPPRRAQEEPTVMTKATRSPRVVCAAPTPSSVFGMSEPTPSDRTRLRADMNVRAFALALASLSACTESDLGSSTCDAANPCEDGLYCRPLYRDCVSPDGKIESPCGPVSPGTGVLREPLCRRRRRKHVMRQRFSSTRSAAACRVNAGSLPYRVSAPRVRLRAVEEALTQDALRFMEAVERASPTRIALRQTDKSPSRRLPFRRANGGSDSRTDRNSVGRPRPAP